MMKMKRYFGWFLFVFSVGLLTLVTPVGAQETEPRWTEVLGSVNCLNSSKERHIIRSDCDVTICEFPHSEVSYVIVSCSSSENVTCVAIGHDGEEDCTEPEVME